MRAILIICFLSILNIYFNKLLAIEKNKIDRRKEKKDELDLGTEFSLGSGNSYTKGQSTPYLIVKGGVEINYKNRFELVATANFNYDLTSQSTDPVRYPNWSEGEIYTRYYFFISKIEKGGSEDKIMMQGKLGIDLSMSGVYNTPDSLEKQAEIVLGLVQKLLLHSLHTEIVLKEGFYYQICEADDDYASKLSQRKLSKKELTYISFGPAFQIEIIQGLGSSQIKLTFSGQLGSKFNFNKLRVKLSVECSLRELCSVFFFKNNDSSEESIWPKVGISVEWKLHDYQDKDYIFPEDENGSWKFTIYVKHKF